MADDAPKLSRKERLFLSNQMRILEALYPEEAQYISTQRVAVERGYEFLYDFELMSHIYEGDDTLSFDEAKRSEEHTSELQSLMRHSYAVFGLKTKTHTTPLQPQ